MADLRDYFTLESIRESGTPLLYAAIALVVFLMSLIAEFPYGDALSTFLAPSGLKVDYQDQHLNLPFGAALDNVRLHYADNAGGLPIVESSKVTLAPTLASLLLWRPGLRIHANLYDGTIRATVTRGGDTTYVSFVAKGIELARLQPLNLSGMRGLVSGDGSIELGGANAMDGSGSFELSGKRLVVRFTPTMPPMELEDAAGKLTMDHGVVRIEKLEGHSADFSVSVHGTIRLAQSVPQSTVDLSVALRPTPQGRNRLGMLLRFLPHPPNSQPYIVRGPLTFPSIS